MTGTLTTPAATIAAGIGLRGRQARLLLSECTKFRTLRSTVYTPLIAVVLMIGSASSADSLAHWTGFALLCGYAAILIGFAAQRGRRFSGAGHGSMKRIG